MVSSGHRRRGGDRADVMIAAEAVLKVVGQFQPTGQNSTLISGIGKSFGLPVAKRPPMLTAAAATRQSACESVFPRSENSRLQRPAISPSALPSSTIRNPAKRASAAANSRSKRPRTTSSMFIGEVKGVSPITRSAKSCFAAGRPLSASIRTVVSTSIADKCAC